MKTPKNMKPNQETAGKIVAVLMATGTIIKAGIEIAKAVGKSKS